MPGAGPCRGRTLRRAWSLPRPVAGQEDADFPELQVNEDGIPLTTEVLVPLKVAPPAWLATEGMEKTSHQGAASRGSSLTC